MNINRLPPEILKLILFEAVKEESGKPSTVANHRLLGVCFQWKNLLVTNPGFWTNVHIWLVGDQSERIHSGGMSSTPNPDRYLKMLDLQLQRAGSNLLDVFLCIDVEAELARPFFGLMLHRAPFRRWRTLEILKVNWGSYALPITREDDGFVNLESIEISYECEPDLVRLIDRTATSKMTVFHANLSFEEVQEFFPNILSKISELELGIESRGDFSPPPNVVTLTLPSFQLNSLSHILHLTLTYRQSITPFFIHDWTNLVSLDFIVGDLHSSLPPAQQIVSFPSLETLIIRGTLYIALAHFSAPRLRDLQFIDGWNSVLDSVDGLHEVLSHPSFLLSPSGVIEVHFPLNKKTLTDLIWAFPLMKTLKLHFEEDYDGWETVKSVFCNWRTTKRMAIQSETEATSSHSTVLMQQLVSLDLRLKWDYEEGMSEDWKVRMLKVLEDTKGTSLNEIRCSWMIRTDYMPGPGGSYILLVPSIFQTIVSPDLGPKWTPPIICQRQPDEKKGEILEDIQGNEGNNMLI
ncbi:hypothetical protein FRC15_008536 [Serendipita sp. 397]|nr:hypothetical protein FRC15_008536 [Serendipita sp. 397]